jgi:hypothetical protein
MNGYALLVARLRIWQRWYRFHQGVFWGWRGALVGTLSAVIGTSFAITTNSLQASTYLIWQLTAGLGGMVLGSLYAWLRPLPLLEMARRYEQQFALKERISTAIELQTNQLISVSWREMQLADSLEASANVSPRTSLDWRLPRLEIITTLFILMLIAGTWLYGQGSFERAQVSAHNQALIETQVNDLRQIITEIERNEQLSDADREKLLAPLQRSLDDLGQADTLEEAVSILSEVQHALDEISNSNKHFSQSLQELGERMAAIEENRSSPFGEALSGADFRGAAEELGGMELGVMEDQALQALAEELEQTAQELENKAPELAEQLQDAAQKIQSEDLQAAEQTLEEASEEMLEALQNMDLSEISEQTSETLEASKEDLLEAANAAPPLQDVEKQQMEAEQTEGKRAESTKEGDSEENAAREEVNVNPINQTGSPNSIEETEYDSVYAPQRLDAESSSSEELTPSGEVGESTLGETTSIYEQAEQSLVPYYEVFMQYEASVHQSFQSGVIPLALRPLVRDYFSSLAP